MGKYFNFKVFVISKRTLYESIDENFRMGTLPQSKLVLCIIPVVLWTHTVFENMYLFEVLVSLLLRFDFGI